MRRRRRRGRQSGACRRGGREQVRGLPHLHHVVAGQEMVEGAETRETRTEMHVHVQELLPSTGFGQVAREVCHADHEAVQPQSEVAGSFSSNPKPMPHAVAQVRMGLVFYPGITSCPRLGIEQLAIGSHRDFCAILTPMCYLLLLTKLRGAHPASPRMLVVEVYRRFPVDLHPVPVQFLGEAELGGYQTVPLSGSYRLREAKVDPLRDYESDWDKPEQANDKSRRQNATP